MKKEFLLLSALISSAIFAYLIYPISDLKQLDKQNVSEKSMVDTLKTNELTQNKDNIEFMFLTRMIHVHRRQNTPVK